MAFVDKTNQGCMRLSLPICIYGIVGNFVKENLEVLIYVIMCVCSGFNVG